MGSFDFETTWLWLLSRTGMAGAAWPEVALVASSSFQRCSVQQGRISSPNKEESACEAFWVKLDFLAAALHRFRTLVSHSWPS